MEKRDARLLNPAAQEEVRRQAIKLLQQGQKQAAVAQQLEVSRQRVNGWWKRFELGGWSALRKRKRGPKNGSNRKLNQEQEQEIQKLISDKTPDQLKLRYALWTREAVRELILERYGVSYAMQSLSVVLKRWGFTPQRPLKRAYEQRPKEVQSWLEESYPAIEAKAKAQGAEIWWGDETAVKAEAHVRRSFAPKGKTPVIRQPAKRFHSSIISAINNQGKMQWMSLHEALNVDTFLKFLRQLIKYRKRKIILIVDNLKVHHAKAVKAWLEEHKHRIELHYLPSYSPELNPDEYLNNDLKQNLNRDGVPTNKDELTAKVRVTMFMLEGATKKIRSFFRHPKVTYAA
jgi:transposase